MRTALEDQAKHVASRLDTYFRDVPEGEVSIDPEDPLLREIAVEPVGAQGYTMVFNQSGVVILHPVRAMEGRSLKEVEDDNPGLGVIVDASRDESITSVYQKKSQSGRETQWLISCAHPRQLNLIVAATIPREDRLSPVRRSIEEGFFGFTRSLNEAMQESRNRFLRYSLIYVFAMAVVVAIVGSRLAASIVRPIKELTRAVQGLGAGDVRSIVGVSQRDEIGELARSFVQMKRDIKLYREQINQKQKELTAANEEIRRFNQDLEQRIQERTRELEEALEELKSLDKNKDDFIALVSHELRTPLTSIVACTEGLGSMGMASDPEQRDQLLEIIRDESQRLSRLITDVLQIQRMEAGRMPFDFRKINLPNLAEKACINMRQQARRKNIQIRFEKADDPRLKSVAADADRILQVMTNLVSNAVKFSPGDGDIDVEVSVFTDTEGETPREVAQVSVRDQGIGIQGKDAKRVFDKFFQAELIDHHSEGSGLGLPIARHIVEEHGGRLWFEGLSDGTVFRFTLPFDGE